MKSSEFSDCLKRSADLLRAAHVPTAGAFERLAAVFRLGASKKVSDTAAKLRQLQLANASFLQTKVESVAAIMPAITNLVSTLAPKSKADFELVSDLLASHSRASLDDWIERAAEALSTASAKKSKAKSPPQPPSTELVDRYRRLLETALGDDIGFRDAYSRLEADPGMRSAELILLAKHFASASVRTGPAALKKIFARHQALMIGRAAAAATAGRVAG